VVVGASGTGAATAPEFSARRGEGRVPVLRCGSTCSGERATARAAAVAVPSWRPLATRDCEPRLAGVATVDAVCLGEAAATGGRGRGVLSSGTRLRHAAGELQQPGEEVPAREQQAVDATVTGVDAAAEKHLKAVEDSRESGFLGDDSADLNAP